MFCCIMKYNYFNDKMQYFFRTDSEYFEKQKKIKNHS